MINLLSGIDSTAAALNAERTRLDVVSENIANVNTTKGLDGKPYQRQQVIFEAVLNAQQASQGNGGAMPMTQVARVTHDSRPPRMIFDPSHPDANKDGLVAMPDINIHEEMVDMIAGSRSYEANLAVVKNAHQMAMQALSIGKH